MCLANPLAKVSKNSPAFVNKLREQDVQRTIIAWLRLKRYFFWRNNTGAMVREKTHSQHRAYIKFGTPGAPDLFVIRRGDVLRMFPTEIFGIECKAWNGKQSANQKAFEEAFRAAGGIYVLAKSLDDVMMAME